MKCARILIVILALGWGMSGVASMVVTTNYYQVSGNSEFELRQSILRQRPATVGTHMDARTDWHVKWEYTLRTTGEGCRLRSFSTRTSVVITLPRWVPDTNAPPPLVQRWNRYMKGLYVHEAGHVQFAVMAANQLRARVGAITERPACDALEKALNDTANQVLAEVRAREKLYDEQTRHGATQDAVFP